MASEPMTEERLDQLRRLSQTIHTYPSEAAVAECVIEIDRLRLALAAVEKERDELVALISTANSRIDALLKETTP
jgi:hypothetical protein